jgi:hypothetical protein
MGGRFWLACIGCVIVVCVAGLLFFTLIGKAWEAFGALGATIFAMCLIVGVAWVYDRAATRNR